MQTAYSLSQQTTDECQLLAVAQSVAIFRAIHYGLGRREEKLAETGLESMKKVYCYIRLSKLRKLTLVLQGIYASDILFVSALVTSKLAVAQLLLRLSSARNTILAAYVLMGIIGVWGIAAILAAAIRPDTAAPWKLDTKDAKHIVSQTACRYLAPKLISIHR